MTKRQFLLFCKMFGEPVRLEILLAIRWSEGDKLCVNDIVEAVRATVSGEISHAGVSHHLSILRASGVVDPMRDGKRIFYSLTGLGLAFMKFANSMSIRPESKANPPKVPAGRAV